MEKVSLDDSGPCFTSQWTLLYFPVLRSEGSKDPAVEKICSLKKKITENLLFYPVLLVSVIV